MLTVTSFDFGGGLSVNAFSFLASGLTLCLEIFSPKYGTLVYQSDIVFFKL